VSTASPRRSSLACDWESQSHFGPDRLGGRIGEKKVRSRTPSFLSWVDFRCERAAVLLTRATARRLESQIAQALGDWRRVPKSVLFRRNCTHIMPDFIGYSSLIHQYWLIPIPTRLVSVLVSTGQLGLVETNRCAVPQVGLAPEFCDSHEESCTAASENQHSFVTTRSYPNAQMHCFSLTPLGLK
jgi:hypothetical protein